MSYQVGGTHYNVGNGRIEHRHYCAVVEADYFIGCATKYVQRWRQKGGVQDLLKAKHFVEFEMETLLYSRKVSRIPDIQYTFWKAYVSDNSIPKEEASIIYSLFHWRTFDELRSVHAQLCKFIEEESGEPTANYVNQG